MKYSEFYVKVKPLSHLITDHRCNEKREPRIRPGILAVDCQSKLLRVLKINIVIFFVAVRTNCR